MEIPLLTDFVILASLSIAVLLFCSRCRIPPVVGLLLTGVLSGPHGLALIGRVSEVEFLAEVGVILLLFVIGIEFSLKRLMQIKRLVLVGGALQVGLTAFVAGLFSQFGFAESIQQSIFYGLLVALSSTAIVLKLFQEKGVVETPHGQSVLAILIFQDIAVVPMVLLVPFLAGGGGDVAMMDVAMLFGKIALVLCGLLIAAQVAVPYLLYQIARTRNTQLFILSVLAICFAVAWVTSTVGLSLALGAFLAGLIISESEYSLHATGYVLPFEQVFTSFFFISIGMLLDVHFVISHLLTVIAVSTVIVLIKLYMATLAILLMGYSLRVAALVGWSLCQVGEFAFILAAEGAQYNLIAGDAYQLFLSVSLLTMSLSPLFIAYSPFIVNYLHRFEQPRFLTKRKDPDFKRRENTFRDHVIIIGFGVCGRNLARVAEETSISYAILDTNPETVRIERERGRPIFFGDASQRSVLEQVDVESARIAVVAINDPLAARRIVEVLHRQHPKLYIIARARYALDMEPIGNLGANEVVPEDFEASLAILTSVLNKYLTPQDTIDQLVLSLRSKGYKAMHNLSDERGNILDVQLNLSDMEIGVYQLQADSPLVGKTLAESQIRPLYEVTLLMLRRQGETLPNPAPDLRFQVEDILVVFGAHKPLLNFAKLQKTVESITDNKVPEENGWIR